MDWRHEAACREVDPELFFPIGNSGPALLQIDEAKQVCRRCAVMDDCLRWPARTPSADARPLASDRAVAVTHTWLEGPRSPRCRRPPAA
jgi:hypothetical protein